MNPGWHLAKVFKCLSGAQVCASITRLASPRVLLYIFGSPFPGSCVCSSDVEGLVVGPVRIPHCCSYRSMYPSSTSPFPLLVSCQYIPSKDPYMSLLVLLYPMSINLLGFMGVGSLRPLWTLPFLWVGLVFPCGNPYLNN